MLELDQHAQVITYEEYYPYGSTSYQAVRSSTETPKRYRYTGKERDTETGLYYHGARYYAPWLGRWVSADPGGLIDGPNLYLYSRDNPTKLADATGTQASVPEMTVYKSLDVTYQAPDVDTTFRAEENYKVPHYSFKELGIRIPHTERAPHLRQPVHAKHPKTPSPTAPGGGQQIAWGAKVSPAFKAKVISIAHDLGTSPDYLMAAMAFESAGTFSPSVRNAKGSGAVGLIQFMPSTAEGLGTTTEALRHMTAEQQLDYVRKYFKHNAGRLKTLDDVYMAILWPSAVGKPEDTVLFAKKPGTSCSAKSKDAYCQNSPLDTNHDDKVTKAEAAAAVRERLRKGQQPGMAK